MKSKTEHSGEYNNFTNALRKVLSVSHEEMQRRLRAEKEKKSESKRTSSSGRASE